MDHIGVEQYPYWHALGMLEQAEGNFETALAAFIRATEFVWNFLPRCTLAQAYLDTNKPAEAIQQLEAALAKYDGGYPWGRIANPIVAVRAYYLLGRAYEASGSDDNAIEQYETFIGIWKNADPELQIEVADARKRLAKLKEI